MMSEDSTNPRDSREDTCPDTTAFSGTDASSPLLTSSSSSSTPPSQVTYSHCTILHIKEAHISITSESITALHAASRSTSFTTSSSPSTSSQTTFQVSATTSASVPSTLPFPVMTSSGILPIPTITSTGTASHFSGDSPPNIDMCDFSHIVTSTSSLDLLDMLTSQPITTNPDPTFPNYMPIGSPPTPLCDEATLYTSLPPPPVSSIFTSAAFSISTTSSPSLQAPRPSLLPTSLTTVQSLLDLPARPVYLTARSTTTRSTTTRTTTARSSISSWNTHIPRLGSSRGRPRRFSRSSTRPLLPKVTEHNNRQPHHHR